MDTLRRLSRVVSLLALDLAALFLAILTALILKAWGLGALDEAAVSSSLRQTEDLVSFAFLVCALLFARSGLYAGREQRPGLTRIVAGLFQTTVVALVFAVVNGLDFSSYYIFYGSLFFAVAYVASFRYVYEWVTGSMLRAAGYRRRAILVGTGEHIEAVAHALGSGSDSQVNVIGFVSLTPLPQDGLLSLGDMREIGSIVAEHRADEVIIADPAFPEQEAIELVDQCHQRGVAVRIAPSTMEILVHRAEFVPGQSVPLFELRPPVFEGFDYAVKRSFDLVGSALLMLVFSPVLLGCALLVKFTSPGPVLYRSMRPGIGGVPFACFKFRTMYRDADERQLELESLNEATRRAVQDPRRPADDAGRAPHAPLLDRRAAAAHQRRARADVARRSPPAAPARLRAARGLAQEALPRHARDHRPVAGLRARRPGLRRPRAPRLPLPRALVGLPGPDDPAQDRPRRVHAARGVLAAVVKPRQATQTHAYHGFASAGEVRAPSAGR